jgi:surface antigen
VRTGIPSVWVNPDTGHQYSVMPTRTYDTATGPCREYTVDAIIGGQRETIYGSASLAVYLYLLQCAVRGE